VHHIIFCTNYADNRWAIITGRPWSKLIGAPIASIGAAERLCRLGLTSALASEFAAGCPHRSGMMHPQARVLLRQGIRVLRKPAD